MKRLLCAVFATILFSACATFDVSRVIEQPVLETKSVMCGHSEVYIISQELDGVLYRTFFEPVSKRAVIITQGPDGEAVSVLFGVMIPVKDKPPVFEQEWALPIEEARKMFPAPCDYLVMKGV